MDYLKLESVKVILKFDTVRIFEMLAISAMTLDEIVIFTEKTKHVQDNPNILSYLVKIGQDKLEVFCKEFQQDHEITSSWNDLKNINDSVVLIKTFFPILQKKGFASEDTIILIVILLIRIGHI